MVREIVYKATVNSKPLPPTKDLLRNIFKKYDTNNDNKLSRKDLKKAFEYLGSIFPGIRANQALHHADANKDGFIDEREMDELVNYAIRVGFDFNKISVGTVTSDQPRKILKQYDVENDGQPSRADIKKANQHLDSVIPGFGVDHANTNGEKFNEEEGTNELVKHAARLGYTVKISGGTVTDDQLRKLFKHYDVKNDGQLSRADIKKAYQYLDSFIPGFGVDHANANGEKFNEEEGMNELVKHAARLGYTVKISGGTETDDQLRKIFEQYDVKNDGQLSRADIKKAYQYHNKEELNELVKDAVRLGFTVKP